MALILNIDTATDYASLALASDGKLMGVMKNPELRDHASWIHQAIHDLLIKCGHSLQELNAIAVSAGPGSYTGLRIGMATAKGLCYILNIPLIAVNTLKVMAAAFVSKLQPAAIASKGNEPPTINQQIVVGDPLFVPMIDARRMEVYTAVYDRELNEVMRPSALILDDNSFREWADGHRLIFFGNGSKKFEALSDNEHFEFEESSFDASAMVSLSHEDFLQRRFANLAYAEPFYLKEFFSTGKK